MAKLLVVATPIGNLGDLTPRMEQALREADLIAAEDTRVTMKLLNHLGIKTPLISCHRHNEEQKAGGLVERMLRENLTVALTSDAGTPAISDPGVHLVREAWAAGVEVTPICGPSAVTAALSACGFDAREFAFYGFLPRERKPLREKLRSIRQSGMPVAVFFESPHRVVKLAEEIAQLFPECGLAVLCDISKRYEKVLVGRAEGVLEQLCANPNVEKGEYCVVVDFSGLRPAELEAEAPQEGAAEWMLRAMLDGRTLADAAREVMERGCPRNEVYRAKLKIQRMIDESR